MRAKPLKWTKFKRSEQCQYAKPTAMIEFIAGETCWEASVKEANGVLCTVAEGNADGVVQAKRKCQSWWNRFCRSIARNMES